MILILTNAQTKSASIIFHGNSIIFKNFQIKIINHFHQHQNFLVLFLFQQYFELRSAMVASEEEKGKATYPHKFEVTSSIPQYLITYEKLQPNEELINLNVSVAGRVIAMRAMSKNLRFYDVQADGKSVQIVANLKDFKQKGDNARDLFLNNIKIFEEVISLELQDIQERPKPVNYLYSLSTRYYHHV